MKTAETLIVEKVLLKGCFGSNPKLAREYGVSEVTIGFQRNGNGREVADFVSYDPKKDIFRCYEIKVSMQDLKSSAKKSWYGNYNYLVITQELFEKKDIDFWHVAVPADVGIIIVNTKNLCRKAVKRSRYADIDINVKNMLKDSMIRTLFYKNAKINTISE